MSKEIFEGLTLSELAKLLTLKSWLIVLTVVSMVFAAGVATGSRELVKRLFTPASVTESRRLECIGGNVEFLNEEINNIRIAVSTVKVISSPDLREAGMRTLMTLVHSMQTTSDYISEYVTGDRIDCNL